ncbi:MAG: STELLO glycosyltransferase family protein [Halioglobus sp.]
MKRIGFACTTINPRAQALVETVSVWRHENLGPISLALDRKTPDPGECANSSEYIQHDSKPETSFERLCPWDSYSRKNISFARLARSGVDFIFETDDDNSVYGEGLVARIDEALSFFESTEVLSPSEVSNIFSAVYNVSNKIWARGYPLYWLEREPVFHSNTNDCVAAGVIQFLVDGNPDVDAIYRLVFGNDFSLDSRNFDLPIYTFRNFHPFNSQATLWPRDQYPLMYLPSYCDFRMTDIWRSYIAQHVMYAYGNCVVYAPALVKQQRNEHLIYDDFFGEHEGYKKGLLLLNILDGIEVDSSQEKADSLLTIYSILVDKNFFDPKELVLLDAYLASIL